MTDVLRQIKNKWDDQVNAEDKQENRASACFESLEEERIQICNPDTREVVTMVTHTLKKDPSGRYDINHCLGALKEINLVDCDTLPKGFTLKINSDMCFNLLKKNNVELCFNDSGIRCTKSNYWEKEINDWQGKEPSELCQETFKKYSLVPCENQVFNVSKCLDVLKHNTLYFRNKWIEINQAKFDNLCCKSTKKDAPFCYAFFSKEFNGDYTVENCQKELTGLDIHLLSNHDEV